jgi:hypothetical protein
VRYLNCNSTLTRTGRNSVTKLDSSHTCLGWKMVNPTNSSGRDLNCSADPRGSSRYNHISAKAIVQSALVHTTWRAAPIRKPYLMNQVVQRAEANDKDS